MSVSGLSMRLLICGIALLLASPVAAFGAGNIASVAKIEGINWRHGDIEDTLLSLLMARVAGGKKFNKVQVSRVYFGNWLRDYSQAIDVGTVKYVSAEAIRILLWVLGFMTFGYGTKEFEVTAERLGCYRPEDHIDNPKDYADNVDATKYDARLRGPVNEQLELAIDPQTGMKNFIANERVGIMTSALHVRKLFGECVRLARSYARYKNKAELYEALRLLGTGLHCLEDYAAHSNYIELALIELGEHNIFPHVGRHTKVLIPGAREPVYPITTGTFGGVDFLHSVLGEFNDKATQSEIQELEGVIKEESKGDYSLLKELLGKIPKGVFEGQDQVRKADELKSNSTNAQMDGLRVSTRQPEEFTRQIQDLTRQIYPILEWHDDLMKSISKAIEKVPFLPDLISNLEEQINIFVFSLIAPFVLPLINQVKNELNTGSSEIIKSSKDKQFIVFNDDYSNDPTHSMLAKDHFSNILNEPAGKIASEALKWVVPQLMQCWDDESIDAERTINRILQGILYHPALRDYGEDGAVDGRRIVFGVVEKWWSSKDRQEKNDLRRQLSRDGVKNGENHQGTPDCGHGCGHPIKMNKKIGNMKPGSGSALDTITGLNSAHSGTESSSEGPSVGKIASKITGGGVIGGLVGAIADGIGGTLLSGRKHSTSQNFGSLDHTQEESKPSNYESSPVDNLGVQAGYQKIQDQGSGRIDGYQGHSQVNSQFGGRINQFQDINNPASQYSGRTDQYQSDSQFGGRTDQYQGINNPTSQYSGRTEQYQSSIKPASQYVGRTDQYQSDSQFGGRTDQYQGINNPVSQYGGRTDQYQSESQFGSRTDQYQGINSPASQYGSRTEQYQSDSQFSGRAELYQGYNQSGTQFESEAYGQHFETSSGLGKDERQSGENRKDSHKGKGHRKYSKYDTEYRSQDEYRKNVDSDEDSQDSYESKGRRKNHSKHRNSDIRYEAQNQYRQDVDNEYQQRDYSERREDYSHQGQRSHGRLQFESDENQNYGY